VIIHQSSVGNVADEVHSNHASVWDCTF